MSTSRRILVAGAGALGIITAVRLALAGHQVVVTARSEERRSLLRTRGFRADSPDAAPQHLRLDVVVQPDEVKEPFDVLIVATKCAVAAAVAEQWMPVLAESGIFVPYVNGLMGDEMKAIADDRLVECAVYYPATLLAPGHSQLTGKGHLHLGPWPRGAIGPESRAARIAGLLSAVVPTYIYEDMYSVKWNKLIANSAMTSLGVVSGETMAGMMKHSAIRTAFLELLKESLTIGKAAGAKTMSLAGFDVGSVIRLPRFLADIALRLSTRRHGLYKSSSQQSLERGEPTEVDYLNGRVVEEADRRGLGAPWNAEIVAAVHAIEANPASAGIGRVDELAIRVRRDQR